MKYHLIVAALMLYMTYPWEARASGEAYGFVPVKMQSGCVRVYVCTYLRRVATEAALDGIRYSRRVWGQPGHQEFFCSHSIDGDDEPAAGKWPV